MRNAIALAYEYSTSRLFYSDIQRGTINMVHFNGTGHATFLDREYPRPSRSRDKRAHPTISACLSRTSFPLAYIRSRIEVVRR